MFLPQVLLDLCPQPRPAFHTSLPQDQTFEPSHLLSSLLAGAGNGGRCYSPKLAREWGVFPRAPGRSEGAPLGRRQTDFLQHPVLTKPQQPQEQDRGRQPRHGLCLARAPGRGGGQWWPEVREHQLKVQGSMKWGFMLEVSVSSAMPPDLLARPAHLLSAEGGAPEL